MGTMISGWDPNIGYSIYYVDSEGSCIAGDVFCVGSGGSLAYAVLDGAFKELDNHSSFSSATSKRKLGIEAATNLAARAIRYAMHRDSYSGGYINVFHINETGIHHVFRNDSRQIAVGSIDSDTVMT